MKLFFKDITNAAVFEGQFYNMLHTKGYITIYDICNLAEETPACIHNSCEAVSYAINSDVTETVYKYTGYILRNGIPEMFIKFREDLGKWMIKVMPDPQLVIPTRLEVTHEA